MPKAAKQRHSQPRGSQEAFTHKIFARKDPNVRDQTVVSTVVTLSVPEEDDECPLTLDPIKDSQVAFLPGMAFCKGKPLHTKLTLPCGHGFHSLSLLYSWCKNGMRCPCCRAGHSERADTSSLPSHLRAAFADKVKDSLSTEHESDALDNVVHIYGVTVPYTSLSQAGCLMMVMSFFERVESALPLFSFTAALDESGGTEERPRFSPRCHFPSISHLRQLQVGAVQLQVHIEVPEVGIIGIDSCQPVAIVDGTASVPGAHGSFVQEAGSVHLVNERTRFEVSAAEGWSGLAIMGLRWCPEGQFMELLSTNE